MARVDNQIVTERHTGVDRQPDGRVVHLLGPDSSRQHDLSLSPRGRDRIRSGHGWDRIALKTTCSGRGTFLAASAGLRPWLDLTEDDGCPAGQDGQRGERRCNTNRCGLMFVPSWPGGLDSKDLRRPSLG